MKKINTLVGLVLSCGMIIGVTIAEAGKITLIEPTLCTVGTTITVEGEGYVPSETIRIDLKEQFGAVQTNCNGEGTFSTAFVLGRHPAGENKFVVVGFTSYSLDRGTFAVQSRISSITPTSGKVGEFVFIDGDGYGAGEQICVSFGQNKEIKTIFTDGQGAFSLAFTTDPQSAGIKKIIVTGVNSKESNTRQYTLVGGIQSVLPTHGCVGTEITVRGAGFGDAEPIRVDFGKTEGIIRTKSATNGEFSFVFIADTQYQGRKDILVNGLTTGEAAQEGFIITPNIDLVTPTRGIVGSMITITATGFGSSEPIRIDLGRTLAAGRTDSDENGAFTTQIKVTPQPGGVSRRLAVVGLRTRQISFTDVFSTMPTIKITPSVGKVESDVLVHGDGFPSNESIRIDFGKTTNIALATADNRSGNFDVGFKVVPHPAGKSIVRVRTSTDGEVIEDNFIVQSRIKLISPFASGALDDEIEIQGDGFGANESVRIDLGNTREVGSGVTDLEGNFVASFKVDAQSGGNKTCTVTGLDSGEEQNTTFAIKGKVVISPTAGYDGTTVTVTGSGYLASESVRVDVGDATKIANATADDNGTFMTDLTVHIKKPGDVRVRTIGLNSWTVNTVNFVVLEEKKEEEIKSEEGAANEGEQKGVTEEEKK
ncbi:MAG: hypothetical protein QME42_07530 [bacterium]|nr:hypothetical protein [bacterium]